MGRPLKWLSHPGMQSIVSGNREQQKPLSWLDLQDAKRYQWRRYMRRTYYRPLGVVESLFDADGSLYCGRADLHQNIRFEIRTNLSDDELRQRILLAWAVLQHDQVILSCGSRYLSELNGKSGSSKWTEKCFVYNWPESSGEAVAYSLYQVKFVEDAYPDVNPVEFYDHIMNSSRALDARNALSKLYVMPFQRTQQQTVMLHFITVLAHQIVDGLTTFRWAKELTALLNMNDDDLREKLDSLCSSEENLLTRLPLAQEAYYPVRSHSQARERWHWLITRVLRHARIPPPASFQNPLRRPEPLAQAQSFPSKYKQILDYSEVPPLNSGRVSGDLYGRSVQNMRRLCKEAGISIGSGLFTLVAMAMMEMEQRRHSDVPLKERLPFVGSFPVNPRPFLAGEPTTGSCMLAFSDGVTLPFLPRDLEFNGRFRLLGKQAHKQLRQYQKRKRSTEEKLHLGSRSPEQLIPALYCSTLERMENRAPEDRKTGINVQGLYPAKASPTLATCGISSVGDVSAILKMPVVDLDNPGDKDLVAEFKGISSCVRPRDGEFLVGASGDQHHLGFLVAYDANAIDPAKAEEWKELMVSMLDKDLFPAEKAKL